MIRAQRTKELDKKRKTTCCYEFNEISTDSMRGRNRKKYKNIYSRNFFIFVFCLRSLFACL